MTYFRFSIIDLKRLIVHIIVLIFSPSNLIFRPMFFYDFFDWSISRQQLLPEFRENVVQKNYKSCTTKPTNSGNKTPSTNFHHCVLDSTGRVKLITTILWTNKDFRVDSKLLVVFDLSWA